MYLNKYVQEVILKLNSASNSVPEIVKQLQNVYSPYIIRKFLKSQPGIFIPAKPNPNPPIDQITSYKIINMYNERMPLTDKQKEKYEKSHRKIKGKRKYSMRDLANKLGFSKSTIWSIINANRQADVMRRKAMNHAYEDRMAKKFNRVRRERKKKKYVSRKRGPKPLQITPEQFWDNIEKIGQDKCWIWQGSTDKQGYGRCRWGEEENTKYSMTSRIAATLFDPPLIPDIYASERIKLTCDNPKLCCNPAHMIVTDPVKPRIRSKIKLQEARFILKQVTNNIKTKQEISEELNIRQELVDRIINNPELVRRNIIETL